MTTDVAPPPAAAPPPRPPYPIRLEFTAPERQRILTNLPLFGSAIRLILVYPSLIIVNGILSAAIYGYLAATFVILLRGRYPRGIFKLVMGSQRWLANIEAYLFHLFDDYPPVDLDQREGWWLDFQIDYPTNPNRLLNFPILGFAVKMILLIPHILALFVLYWLSLVVVLIATVAITFSHRFPLGMHRFVAGFIRWSHRVYGYAFALTDRYPPFSMS